MDRHPCCCFRFVSFAMTGRYVAFFAVLLYCNFSVCDYTVLREIAQRLRTWVVLPNYLCCRLSFLKDRVFFEKCSFCMCCKDFVSHFCRISGETNCENLV